MAEDELFRGAGGAVAAPNALAAQAGLDLIHLGGTATDAAIAAMLATYVSEPGIVSALGSAFVNIWPDAGEPVVVDGNCEMPGRGLPTDRFGGGLRKVDLAYGGGITIYAGAGSAATPGAFKAFEEAHRRYGRASWADITAPAIDIARRGFRLGAAAASYLEIVGDSLYGFDPQTRAAHFVDDRPARVGQVITAPDLADSFQALADEGFDLFYRGDLGRRVAQHVIGEGGLITREDLQSYQATVRPATVDRVGSWRLATNPPPSIGGPVLATMLRLLQRRGDDAAQIIAVQRMVLSYRAAALDAAADLESAGAELLEALAENELTSLPSSQDTAHVSAVDSQGNACALTSSAGYSSGVTVPGTGLVLNNCLGEPELNRRGLHAVPPGTRLASNMAPTTGRSDDGAVLAVGSPGADRITTALMQVLAAHCLRDAALQDAINAPRVHVSVDFATGDQRIEAEPDAAIEQAASATGLPLVAHSRHAMYFGGVGAAKRKADGDLQAAADPRRASATAIG
ncbi:gamma-glutamyltransferase [Yimella sp. cx-51]|uniref:gamma-glutamyltransferase n=1 Tax=Yimella sp. cx-51 TaxID=2770551 RepID=UPI00165D7EB7|nr:gamma-glutamyltransferase [Yimella sp. cx-51]MBC9957039.1 gamma-glutamyltransferase [Yimella sp. cx-51]MBD2758346.1 gamma-glutamyltransferase [Yimella sp. cx-573]QTH37295.1 gamma-glutamyltransferase [Yimella sp. cx-51]